MPLFGTLANKTTPLYGGGQVPNPANILVLTAAPSANAIGNPVGTIAVDRVAGISYMAVKNTGLSGSVTWAVLGGATAAVATINSQAPVAGNYVLAGTAAQITATNTAGTTTFSLPTLITAPGSIAATTFITATLGDITATNGDFIAVASAKGPKVVATSVSGATPVVNNVRVGQVGFSDVINTTATGALVLTNSLITASTKIIAMASCATVGSAVVIRDYVSGSGTVTFNVTNLGGTNTGATIFINFWILN